MGLKENIHIEATNTFIKHYKKLDPILKSQVKEALIILQNNPSHPSLGNKKITGQKNVYEIRISRNSRITYSKYGNTIILRKVGKHDIISNP
jgi:mRNA-degrading endonuclease RelE of RelBE toxin-antitoxin system